MQLRKSEVAVESHPTEQRVRLTVTRGRKVIDAAWYGWRRLSTEWEALAVEFWREGEPGRRYQTLHDDSHVLCSCKAGAKDDVTCKHLLAVQFLYEKGLLNEREGPLAGDLGDGVPDGVDGDERGAVPAGAGAGGPLDDLPGE